MPRKTQKQEQTGGPINPQMQYVEEQQFISQEVAGKVGQATSQYQTIFGSDSPSAFATGPSPMQNLLSIVGGVYQGIDAAGKTFQTAVDIDKRKDAKMARNLEEQMKVIDSDPNLTPEQKQWSKFELQGKGFQSALRPETKDFFKYSQDITMHNVEFLEDADNFSNTLFEFEKKSIRMTAAERLEKLPGMYRALEKKYPGFSEKIKESARVAEVKAHELLWKENTNKTMVYFDQALNTFFSSPSAQDRNKIFNLDPESVYAGAMSLMRESDTDATNFALSAEDEEQDSALREILVNRANQALFERQSTERNAQREAKRANYGRNIGIATPGSYSPIVDAIDYGGVGYLSNIAMSPYLQGETGEQFGKNIQRYRDELLGATTEVPDYLLQFWNLSKTGNFNLKSVEQYYNLGAEYEQVKAGIEVFKRLNEDGLRVDNVNEEDLATLKIAAGFMLDAEMNKLEMLGANSENAAAGFAFQALNAYRTDHGMPGRIALEMQQTTLDEESDKRTENETGRALYTSAFLGSGSWNAYSNHLQASIQSIVADFSGRVTGPTMAGYEFDPQMVKDEQTLSAAYAELNKLEQSGVAYKKSEEANKKKNEIVKSIYDVLDAHDLTIGRPRIDVSDSKERLDNANRAAENVTEEDSFSYFEPALTSIFTEDNRVTSLVHMQTALEGVTEGLRAYQEFIPDQIVRGEGYIEPLLQDVQKILKSDQPLEEIIPSVLGMLDHFEVDFQKAPENQDSAQLNAWGIFRKKLKDVKLNLIAQAAGMDDNPARGGSNQFVKVRNDQGTVWGLKPRLGSPEQFQRMLSGRIIPLANEGYVDDFLLRANSEGPALDYLVGSVEQIVKTYQDAAQAEEDPDRKMLAGMIAVSGNEDHKAILKQLFEVTHNTAMSHLVPEKLKNAMRTGFMVPLLNQQTKKVYSSFLGAQEEDPFKAQILTILDSSLPVLLNIENPEEALFNASRMSEALNLSLSRINQKGTYINALNDAEVSNTVAFSSGLEQAIGMHEKRRGVVSTKGNRHSNIDGVSAVVLNGLQITGLPVDSSTTASKSLLNMSTPKLDQAMLGAVFDLMPEAMRSQAQLQWVNTTFMEAAGPTFGQNTGDLYNLREKALQAQGTLLGNSLPSNAQIAVAIVPTQNGEDNQKLRWFPKTPDKEAHYQYDGVEVTSANELRVYLNEELGKTNSGFEIEAYMVSSPNDVTPTSTTTPPNLRYVGPRDTQGLIAPTAPANAQRRVSAQSQLIVSPTSSKDIITTFLTNKNSGFSLLNNQLQKNAQQDGDKNQLHPKLKRPFMLFLTAFKKSTGNSRQFNGGADTVLRGVAERGEWQNTSVQDYGRTVADQEALIMGMAILDDQCKRTLEQASSEGWTQDRLFQEMDEQIANLTQLLDSSNGIQTWMTPDNENIILAQPDMNGEELYDVNLDFMATLRGAAYQNHNRNQMSNSGFTLDGGMDYFGRVNSGMFNIGAVSRYEHRVNVPDVRGPMFQPELLRKNLRASEVSAFNRLEGNKKIIEYNWKSPDTPYRAYLEYLRSLQEQN